jgi:16S rRNA (adenine1518-N6/adenine1519-N6)-dimethyltransferase
MTLAVDGLPPLRDVVHAYGLMAKKSLGQNFLFDLNLTGRIARSAGKLSDLTILEVGPGPGGLTRALLMEGAKRVIAIERDQRCLAALAQIAAHYPGRLEVIDADALDVDMAALTSGAAAAIVANLPYNVATPLLAGWLGGNVWPPWWQSMTLMFQREVAERIVATPDAPNDYGRLSVLAGWRSEANILFDIAPSAFVPPPKVTSSVVQLVPRAHPLPCHGPSLEAVARAAFGQRRKMLRQSLKSLGLNGEGQDTSQLLHIAGLRGTERAEEIPVEGFVALANAYDALRGSKT